MKKKLSLVQVFALMLWHVWSLPLIFADDSDIYSNTVRPNVLIFLDNSGSMADQVIASAYSPSTTYNTPLTFTTTSVYKQTSGRRACSPQPSPCYQVYATSISNVSNSSAQTSLSQSGFWTGRIGGSNLSLYYGNYLNYQACGPCSATDSKINVAKRVLTNLVNNVRRVNFGLMDFKYSLPVGASMIAPVGSSATTIVNALTNINPDSYTPTGEALQDVRKYFQGNYSGYASPIQYSCQANFVIVISDGLWNGLVDPAPIATQLFTQDQSATFTGLQNVIVDTIGFNLSSTDPGVASLQQVAQNGGGLYYTANSETDLEVALNAAVNQVIAATFSFANPVVPTTGTSGTARAYLASFQTNPSSPFWRGYVKAYTRDSSGLIQVDSNGIPLASTMVWDAGQQLSQTLANNRTVFTIAGGSLQNFTVTNSAITNTILGASSNSEHDNIVKFTLGIDAYDENGNGNTTEQRAWKLGDIFHSTPVLVTPPFLASNDSSYNSFKTSNSNRTTVLLAGANDGMLHAFRESDGTELWGFIPPDLLNNLVDMTTPNNQHQYYVDGSPIVADIKIGSNWKTIVIFGERRGGPNYYALDITDPANPQYLWNFTDSKITEAWSTPVIGKVKVSGSSDKWVAFIGGGYDTGANNNGGKAFFVVDLSNGAKLWEYYNSGSATDDRQYMNFSLATSPTAVDLNNDGYIDKVYIADIGGQVWKFDVSPAATLSGGLVTNWTGKRIFAAASSQTNPPATGDYYPAQGIYASPALAYDTHGNLWVYFGTGDLNHPNATSTNRFYGIVDTTNMTNGNTLTESSLTNVTSSTGTISQGWYVILNNNEKVFSTANIFNQIVFFTTFTPTPSSSVTCSSGGGNANLYSVNLTTGDAALNLGNGTVLSPGQSALLNAKSIGTGIPSRPETVISPSSSSSNTGNPQIITGTSNQQITNTPTPTVNLRRLTAWREVF